MYEKERRGTSLSFLVVAAAVAVTPPYRSMKGGEFMDRDYDRCTWCGDLGDTEGCPSCGREPAEIVAQPRCARCGEECYHSSPACDACGAPRRPRKGR